MNILFLFVFWFAHPGDFPLRPNFLPFSIWFFWPTKGIIKESAQRIQKLRRFFDIFLSHLDWTNLNVWLFLCIFRGSMLRSPTRPKKPLAGTNKQKFKIPSRTKGGAEMAKEFASKTPEFSSLCSQWLRHFLSAIWWCYQPKSLSSWMCHWPVTPQICFKMLLSVVNRFPAIHTLRSYCCVHIVTFILRYVGIFAPLQKKTHK